MFIIPGVLVSAVTFPGVVVHEAAHMLFCRIRGVAVLDVCFFRFGNPAGYVVHDAAGGRNPTTWFSEWARGQTPCPGSDPVAAPAGTEADPPGHKSS